MNLLFGIIDNILFEIKVLLVHSQSKSNGTKVRSFTMCDK